MTRFDEEIRNILENWSWTGVSSADISIRIQDNDVRASQYQGDGMKPINITIITKGFNRTYTPADITLSFVDIISPFMIVVATSSEEDLQTVFSNIRSALLAANSGAHWYVISSESIDEENGQRSRQIGIISAYKESYEVIS